MLVHEEVRTALDEGRPVVALESTIIAHGLPRPDNLRVAREIEDVVRAKGAVPATIAIVDGDVRVGLDDAALEGLANTDGVAKCGVRDLAPVLARRGFGATTVAATSHLAERAGIRVFATGGVGGGPRGAAGGLAGPAGSAASIAARRRASTSRRTSGRSRGSASASSARA